MSCTVCKFSIDELDERRDGRARDNWVFTSQRTSVSQVQIIFKLFDILQQEFSVGFVCFECFNLADQIDTLEFQIEMMTRELKGRIESVRII